MAGGSGTGGGHYAVTGARRVVAVLAALDALVLAAGGVRVAARLAAYERVVLPGANMAPAIEPGSRLRCDTRLPERLPRGAVVLFEGDGDTWVRARLVSRVVGLPGETLSSSPDGRDVHVGGTPLYEPYADKGGVIPSFERTRVPEGAYYVLGDNRDASSDSRLNGPVPHAWVVGVCRP